MNQRESGWRRWWMVRWMPFWMVSLVGFGLVVGLFLGLVSLILLGFFYQRSLKYDLDEVVKIREAPLYYDARGRPIARDVFRLPVRVGVEELSPFLMDALMAREDVKFFRHGGIDWMGVGRATLRNVHDMRYTQGASTLTMQLAKNTFEIREKSLRRKLLEMILTKRIELRFSKKQILESYLNRIYFGSGCYGIGQAARTYFVRDVKDLNEGELAMLVGIIRGPFLFSPFRSLSRAMEQRDEVLGRMVGEGMISGEDKKRIEGLPIRLDGDLSRTRRQVLLQDAIRRELDEILGDGQMEDERGLQIFTTIEPLWQRHMQKKLELCLGELDGRRGRKQGEAGLECGAVTLDSETGGVLALVGSRNPGVSGYDRTRARREVGGVVMPFLAAAAGEREKLVIVGQPVQTGRMLGVREFVRLLKRFGFEGPFAEGEDLYRGNLVSSPFEMAVGLAVIANGGGRPKPYLIREIRDASNAVVYRVKPSLVEVFGGSGMDEGRGVMLRKGKTWCLWDTSVQQRDAWLLRIGGRGSTAIWMGCDQPREMGTGEDVQGMLRKLANLLNE